MRVLITGDGGYIGSVLSDHLLERGYSVVGLDIDYFRDCRFFGLQKQTYPRLLKDIREVETSDLEGCDAVIHLAALSNDSLGELDPALTDEINHKATVRLARLAKEAGVCKFIFSSTCSVYGHSVDGLVDEDGPAAPLTEYARSKLSAEHGLRDLNDDEFKTIILRNATAYGSSPMLRTDLVVNDLAAGAYFEKAVKVLSDGSPIRPLVHVEDICQAFLIALEVDGLDKPVNVGSDQDNYTIREIAERFRKNDPVVTVEYSSTPTTDDRSYRVNFSRSLTALDGFQCKWSLEKGIVELLSSFEEHKFEITDYQEGKYVRLKQLKNLIKDGRIDEHLNFHSQ